MTLEHSHYTVPTRSNTLSLSSKTWISFKRVSYSKKSVLHLAYLYGITSQKHNGEFTWLDILDLEEALVEDVGVPLFSSPWIYMIDNDNINWRK